MNKQQDTLNKALIRAADAELNDKLNTLFGEVEKNTFVGLHSEAMDYVPPESLSFGGYAKADKNVWPPAILAAAKQALFEGMKRNHRNNYIASFIKKVESTEAQLEEIRGIAENAPQQ